MPRAKEERGTVDGHVYHAGTIGARKVRRWQPGTGMRVVMSLTAEHRGRISQKSALSPHRSAHILMTSRRCAEAGAALSKGDEQWEGLYSRPPSGL